ncbi:hypothetical protein ACFFX0_01335 [Citricoccus parietis]|uniref:SRCR domain-containing protein n=1 Tax=Citricoccus parietis TaxID=592307 RepID=A0ABV5FT90_9MICC
MVDSVRPAGDDRLGGQGPHPLRAVGVREALPQVDRTVAARQPGHGLKDRGRVAGCDGSSCGYAGDGTSAVRLSCGGHGLHSMFGACVEPSAPDPLTPCTTATWR